MLLKIAWRNIWRNKTRSLVVMGAIIIGIWSIIFLVGMVNGMVEGYIDNTIKNEASHIKVQHPKFIDNKEVKYNIPDASQIVQAIDTIKGVKSVSDKTVTNVMISSGRSNRGGTAIGIVPSLETDVSGIHKKMVEGTYLSDTDKNKIIISKRLAEKLKVKLRSKLVLTFQNFENDITMGAFRISGIFDTGNNMYDDVTVFVRLKDMNRILQAKDVAHEVAILIDDLKDLNTIESKIKKRYPNYLVRNYKEIQPELALFQQQIKMSGIIYMIIFMLALVFGIINTMMMAVLERVRELGVLMAVGMNRYRVFMMIVIETLFLALIAAPIGLLLGYATNAYFNKQGLNMFFYSEEGLRQFGFDNLIYPTVPITIYVQLVVAITFTALIGSLYPAFKAIRLSPVEAIRGSFQAKKGFIFKFFNKKSKL